MAKKQFHLPADQIKPLLVGGGGCFATDMITVHGHTVGYMYREDPEFTADSGWRFFAGGESQEYLDDADNIGIYDVNTIANYDPEIIPFLDASIGTEFEWDANAGIFVEIADE